MPVQKPSIALPALPALHGAMLALLAAALFGVSTPFVQRAGIGLGPFTTAALLYVGAACLGFLLRQPAAREAALRPGDLKRLAWMALFGAAIGPVALAWGLQRTSGTSGSLMLALEAVVTALLARVLYQETLGRRVWCAVLLLLAGGVVLVVDGGLNGAPQLIGLLAILAATIAWGIDNTLSRALAERDPAQVVLGKALLGAGATACIAFVAQEPLPGWAPALALLAIGALGYGLSLRLYLLAQRSFGAARTGSVFAFAPFIGALVAIGLGDRALSWGMAAGGVLMLAGVALHLFERHSHAHTHEPLAHEHAHRHDDGHHDHLHDHVDIQVDGHAIANTRGAPHSHWHQHEPVRHSHAHVPDAHHGHRH